MTGKWGATTLIRILLVDDHPAVMEGTKVWLEQEGDIKVYLAHSADSAMEMASLQSFDVMMIDLYLPGVTGIELSRNILRVVPDAVILIYSGHEVHHHFNLMIETGIFGFVLKTASREQLVAAVRSALRGEVILPIDLVKQLRRQFIPSQNGTANRAAVVSERELLILKEIARGKSNKEIATQLIVSQRSLEYDLTDLFRKLQVKSRIEAVVKAKHLELLDGSDFLQKL